jgi:hypothetical protein
MNDKDTLLEKSLVDIAVFLSDFEQKIGNKRPKRRQIPPYLAKIT